ncbi:MAG: site-specific integrase, partial [Gammaproteobacteria bacterium]|nr:site-specific integrase [Gammaproteobacteria bacterium]
PGLLAVLRRIEAAGHVETARRAKQHVSRIYRFAIAAGRATTNPAAGLEEALAARRATEHFAAIIEPARLGALLPAIDAFDGTAPVRAALKLAPFVFVRPGELRRAEWAEIDLETTTWEIPAHKMKTGRPHVVPLAAQAVAILRELAPSTGAGRYVFPGARTSKRPMSENTLAAGLRRLGYGTGEVTIHGLRATARTLLDEVLSYRADIIEHQLAHAVHDANGRAYNRTSFLAERTTMMQAWADYVRA